MVSASDRQAMIFRLSGGNAYEVPEGRALLESWAGRERAAGSGSRLRGRRDSPPRRGDRNDAGRAAEGEPESQMVQRPGNLQIPERD